MDRSIPKISPLFNPSLLKELEADLVSALYLQRRYVEDLAAYRPTSKAPTELKELFIASKRAVHDLELRIRRLRHGY